jgi:hypothetical protein
MINGRDGEFLWRFRFDDVTEPVHRIFDARAGVSQVT